MMRLPRAVWIQLAILASVTVIAGGVMAFGFVNVPALVGIGRYNVTLELPSSGGLYPTSVVTYRGSEIGRVTSIDVTPDGVRAVLKLQSSTQDSRPTSRRRCTAVRPSASSSWNCPPAETTTIADATRRRCHSASAGRRFRRTSAACWTPRTERCRRSRRTTCALWWMRRTRRSPVSARNCRASSTDRHRWRSRPARTKTRSPR